MNYKDLSDKCKDLYLYYLENNFPMPRGLKPGLMGDYGKFYVASKIEGIVGFEKPYPKSDNKRFRADILLVNDKTIEIKTFHEDWMPSITESQFLYADYFVMLMVNDKWDFLHRFVFTNSEFRELYERGTYPEFEGQEKWLFYWQDSVEEYKDDMMKKAKNGVNPFTNIEIDAIRNPEKYEERLNPSFFPQ